MEKENNKDIEQIGKFGVGFTLVLWWLKKYKYCLKKLVQMKVGSGVLRAKGV